MSDKTVSEKLYVRTKKDVAFSDQHPLAIMTYYENDSKFEKRKETCDDWSDPRRYDHEKRQYIDQVIPEAEKHLIDNGFFEGFKIDDYRSRYRTDNKVFEILDPRGFKIEIYADNLIELILSCDIHKGVIQGKFCWGREGGKNILVSEQEAADIRAASNRVIEIGSVVTLKNDENYYTYLGKRGVVILERDMYDYKPGGLHYMNYYSKSQKRFLFASKKKDGSIFIKETKSLVKYTVENEDKRVVSLNDIKEKVTYHSQYASELMAITDDKTYKIPVEDWISLYCQRNYWGSSAYTLEYEGRKIEVRDNKIVSTT